MLMTPPPFMSLTKEHPKSLSLVQPVSFLQDCLNKWTEITRRSEIAETIRTSFSARCGKRKRKMSDTRGNITGKRELWEPE